MPHVLDCGCVLFQKMPTFPHFTPHSSPTLSYKGCKLLHSNAPLHPFVIDLKVHFRFFFFFGKRKEICERRTFARYAVWCTAVHEQPSEQRVAGNVLLGPRHAEPLAPAAVLPAHFRQVEHLTAAVLPLLVPAVPSWREKSRGEIVYTFTHNHELNLSECGNHAQLRADQFPSTRCFLSVPIWVLQSHNLRNKTTFSCW